MQQATDTAVERWIFAAVPIAVREFEGLSEPAASSVLFLEPYVPLIEGFGIALFDAVAQGAATDARFSKAAEYSLFLRDLVTPQIIDAIVPDGQSLRERLQAGADVLRENELVWEPDDENQLLRVVPVEVPDASQTVPAPEAVHQIFKPFGLWEQHAPDFCRFVLRIHSDDARAVLNEVFHTRAPYWTVRFQEPSPGLCEPTAVCQVATASAAGTVMRAKARQAFLNPILAQKRWTRGKLAQKSGVGRATIQGYWDGTRASINDANRRAIAEVLDIERNHLPT